MSDIAALVAEIDALVEKATKGEWSTRVDETCTLRDAQDNQLAIFTHLHTKTGGRRGPDEVAKNARLAAALVNAWPRLREMAEDAERYRWLRGAETWQPCFAEKGFNGKNGWLYRAGSRWTGRNLDSAIDAAIDAARKEAGRG